MNVRLSFLLVAVLLIFGGTFLVVRFTHSDKKEPDNPWLYHIEDGSIVHIEVSHQGQTVNYDKKPGSAQWYIEGDPALPVFIDKWAGTTLLLSGPRVSRVLSAEPGSLAPYGLDPPVSIIKVTERSGLTYEFHLGNPTPDRSNQYARWIGESTLFTVPEVWARVINQLATDPPYPRLYSIDTNDSIVGFSVTHNSQTVRYGQGAGNQWHILEEPERPVSLEGWDQTMQAIGYPRASQVLSDKIDDPAAYGLDQPQTRVEVFTVGRKTFEIYLGNVTPDGQHRYARRVEPEDPQLYTVPEAWSGAIIRLATDPPYLSAEKGPPGPA